MKKVISIVAIIVGALVLLGVAAPMIMGMVFTISSTNSSVAIIGGADGPTAIMIAETASIGSIIIAIAIGVLFIVAGIWGLRKKNKQD